jgi:phage major head subunit gpT-like protein
MPANQQIYTDALKTYRAAFFAGMGEDTSGWRDYVHELPSDASEEDMLLFLCMSMDLPKFRDRREYFEPAFHQLVIETDEYRKGFKVKDKEFRKDKWGMYASVARDMGRSVPIAQCRTVWDLLCNGFSGVRGMAYDGQFFFDDEHVTDGGLVQSNAWDLEFTPENYDRVYENLETIRLPNGELAFTGDMTTRLICGPKYRSRAKKMFDLLQDGNNPRYQQSEYRVVPHLSGSWANYWFLQVMLAGESRPLMFKEELATRFVEQSAPESEAQFEFAERRYGVDSDWGLSFGRWEVMQGSTGASAPAAA